VVIAASTSAGSGGIATFLLLALDAALYPTLLAAVVILLGQQRPVRLLAAYLAGGMLVSVGLGLAIVLALGGSAKFSQSSGLSWGADLALGGLALLAAVALSLRADQRVKRRREARRERKHPRPEPAAEDAEAKRDPWSQRILARGSVPIVFAAALAINLPGAAYLIALKDLATAHHGVAANVALILLFNVIMFALAEVPLLGLIFARERTEAYVERMDRWVSGHGREIAIGLSALFGAFLIVRGLLNAS
jgi:Sap, sulfolipid-1-addressing protein